MDVVRGRDGHDCGQHEQVITSKVRVVCTERYHAYDQYMESITLK